MPNPCLGRASGLASLLGALAVAMPLQAQDFDSMSKSERKQFMAAYAEIDAIDHVLEVCAELAPDYAAANQAIMAEFKASRAIDRATPMVERFASWAKDQNAIADKTLSLALNLTRKAIRASLAQDPEQCRGSFRNTLFEADFEKTAELIEAQGLPAAEPTTETAAAAPEPVAASPEPAAEQPAAPGVEPAAAAAPVRAGMPTAIGDRVEQLPGISWQLRNGVRQARSGGAYCVWRCVVLQHGEESFPWLIIHEAVPMPAGEAIDEVLSHSKKPVIEQKEVDASAFIGEMSMQPDQLVVRNAYIDDYGSDVERRAFFALERSGLTVAAEIFYPDGIEILKESEVALLAVITTLGMDEAVVQADLAENPIAPTIEAARGAPPSAGQVIYAETPNPTTNALSLSLSYDDDARYLDKTVLESDGPVVDMSDTTYYYVPPLAEGTTIEGVFTSADGYAGVGISVLKSKTLVFNRNGRYTTSAGSGVVGGFLASTGSSSEGEGSYHIDGYTLELRSDDGTVQQDVFFPYMSRTFWPGSDGPSDEFNFINIGGKILYRDDE